MKIVSKLAEQVAAASDPEIRETPAEYEPGFLYRAWAQERTRERPTESAGGAFGR